MAISDLVSYVETYRRFMTLESPRTSICDVNSKAYQDQLTQSLQYMKKCLHQRHVDGVLSANERFFELQNVQLYAFCIEYYLGILSVKRSFFQPTEDGETHEQRKQTDLDHTRNISTRLSFLQEADMFLTAFLDRAESVGLVPATSRREQYKRLETNEFSVSRDEKIQRFHVQREMEKKLMQIHKQREEHETNDGGKGPRKDQENELDHDQDDVAELERQELLTFIQLSVMKSMDEQTAINQEKKMLETMMNAAATDKQDLFSNVHRLPPAPQGQGIEVMRINPQMEMHRETIRSGVFRPGHRLPTMTLEEYADHEMADAVERQKKEQEAPQGPRRYDQLVEDGDEDNEALVEEAVYKDRAWDDWKDANEKGIGNKMGSQF